MVVRKKIYRMAMNFSKAELAGSVSLGTVGISMPVMNSETLEEYRKGLTRQRDSLNFGMLGNDPKYYQDTRMTDITPKPEDFLEVPFRLISATIVGGGTWKATDFSNAAILKKSTSLLDGVPLYKDHETDLDNWVGLVNGVKWTNAFKDASGVDVPAGIDGIVAIDIKTNPKVARGVAAGAIYSNSVTVEFDWEMSHTFENEWDFLNKLGQIGGDGKMIRRVVTAIHNYHESSLVWLGADPFAKAIDPDGNLKNIDISSIYSYAKASFSKTAKIADDTLDVLPTSAELARNFKLNFALEENVLSLARRTKLSSSGNNQNNADMKNFLIAFIATFGEQFGVKAGEEDNLTEERMIGFMKNLAFSDDKTAVVPAEMKKAFEAFSAKALETFKAEKEENKDATAVDAIAFIADHSFVASETLNALHITTTELTTSKEALETKVTELAADAAIGKTYINMKRDEAIRLYGVAVGAEKVEASVVELFKQADDSAINGLLKQYTKEATMKFTGKCGSCGSADFSFQSSFSGDPVEEPKVEVLDVSASAIYERMSQSSMSIGRNK